MKTLLMISLALLLFTGSVNSTTVTRMSFSAVIDAAKTIAVGTVSAVEPVWDDDRQVPFTEVSFEIEETVKGEVGAVLVLRFLGGPAPNGLTLEVSDMPTFAVAQRVVLFADEGTGRACPLIGWWQGLYRVNRNGRGVDTVTSHAGSAGGGDHRRFRRSRSSALGGRRIGYRNHGRRFRRLDQAGAVNAPVRSGRHCGGACTARRASVLGEKCLSLGRRSHSSPASPGYRSMEWRGRVGVGHME